MGIFGVIGTFIVLGTYFGLLEVAQGWYIFWVIVAILNIVSMGANGRSK